jgi:serine/threonine-protein phosphatase 2B catalytic subunit
MLMALLSVTSKEELDEDGAIDSPADEIMVDAPLASEPDESTSSPTGDSATRRQVIKNKIMAIGRLARIFGTLREESEGITELKSRMGVDRLPFATLSLGGEGVKAAIMSFEQAKMSDIENERLPMPGEHASIPRRSTPPVPREDGTATPPRPGSAASDRS